MIIAIDFDGTCVTHDFPRVGKEIGAVPVLKKMIDNGHKLILYTMRDGKTLNDAIKWFSDNEIPLYGINENPTQKRWTTSPKVFAHVYIDDMALGCPLKEDPTVSDRPFVDWDKIDKMF